MTPLLKLCNENLESHSSTYLSPTYHTAEAAGRKDLGKTEQVELEWSEIGNLAWAWGSSHHGSSYNFSVWISRLWPRYRLSGLVSSTLWSSWTASCPSCSAAGPCSELRCFASGPGTTSWGRRTRTFPSEKDSSLSIFGEEIIVVRAVLIALSRLQC